MRGTVCCNMWTWRGWGHHDEQAFALAALDLLQFLDQQHEALMDGAIAANTPVRLAAGLGASRIIMLPTGYACPLKEPPRTMIGKALHAITRMMAWQLMYELERPAEDIDVRLMPTLCPLAVSPFDFSASTELMERAAAEAKKWIDEGGLERRARPQELSPHRHH